MFGTYLDRVRSAAPLIHNMTNYVTANDVANLLLACGASPIMAEDENEAEEVTSICAGLNLNIGTLSRQKLRAMLLAGKEARRLGHPVLLDPVGVGVSRFRMEAAAQIVQEIRPDVIRGNGSEIRMLAAAGSAPARGVDADLADAVTEDQLAEAALRGEAAGRAYGMHSGGDRKGGSDHGRQNLLLYFQWQAGDEQDYRDRMSAFRPDDRFSGGESGAEIRSGGSRSGSDGTGRRDWLEPDAGRRWKCRLQEQDHRRCVSYGWKMAG